MTDRPRAGAKSAEIVPFPKGAAPYLGLARPTAMSETRQRALDGLAAKLKEKELQGSDLETIARNWHGILGDLKTRGRFKNKAEVYSVLLRKGSDADAQKKAFYYELPESVGEDDARRRKIIRSSRKWLALAERAAELDHQQKYHFLPRLLARTSLAPGQLGSTLETPNEVRAVLALATEACRSVASAVDVEQYFRDWSRLWVGYRRSDDAYRAGAWEDLQFWDVGANSNVSSNFHELTNEFETTEYWTLLPLPSARIALCVLLGPMKGRLYRYVGKGNLSIDASSVQNVRVTYTRDFRIAIATDALAETIGPTLEIRDDIAIEDASSGELIRFLPGEFFISADKLLTDLREEIQEEEPSAAEASDGMPLLSWHCGDGRAFLPEGEAWRHLDIDIPRQTVERHGDSSGFNWFTGRYVAEQLGNHYCLLTAGSAAAELFKSQSFGHVLEVPGRDFMKNIVEGREAFGEDQPTLSRFGLLSWLESQLLEGKDGALYKQLLASARDKAQRFNTEYQKVLEEVLQKHQAALESFAERE